MGKKVAVILFNQGEPDCLDAVKPYIFNKFYDPALLTVANPLRWMMAKSIASQSAPKARNTFREIGDISPLMNEIQKKKTKLEAYLSELSNDEFKCFSFMRYWKPYAKDIFDEVKEFLPDEMILVPLYPQYSITTTGSALIEWNKQVKKKKIEIPFRVIKDYPENDFFIDSIVGLINEKLKLLKSSDYRLLLSAHGIPKKTIESGDPFQSQVEKTSEAIDKKLNNSELDIVTCYQRQIGPLEQQGPLTEDEIERAALENKNIIIVPISFISECSETLVELDINYKEVAEKAGIKDYIRIKTVQDNDQFILGLANLIMENRV